MYTAENGQWLGRRPRDQIATKGPVTHGFAWAAPRRMLVPILETQAEETQGVAVRDKTPVLEGGSFAPLFGGLPWGVQCSDTRSSRAVVGCGGWDESVAAGVVCVGGGHDRELVKAAGFHLEELSGLGLGDD